VAAVGKRGTVGINASIIGENPTGLGLYTINLIRELDRLRDDLLVYTSSPEALGSLRARIAPVSSAVRPERGLRGHFARLVWTQSVLRARARIDRLGVMLNTVPEGILGFPIPQVTVVHDIVPMLFPAEYPRQQYYFRLLVPWTLRASRVVVADSESTQRDIIEIYGLPPGQVRVIHPGYDPDAYFFDEPAPAAGGEQERYFIYVGNLLPHKNLLRLLDALAILQRRRPCRLIIRGEGRSDYTRALRERIETLGLGERVALLEYAGGRALRDLYARAVALVLPSLHEGFGLPVLEAMACGTPVIASRGSSLSEVAGDASLMVDPYDAIGFAETMYRLLTNRDLRDKLRQRGLQRARSFGWRRTAERMSRLLDEVVGAA
jgi:glycosyltransferase involved in cell wall biosynthesis